MADLANLLIPTIFAPIGKLLVKRLCQDPAAEFGSGIVDYLATQAATTLSNKDRRDIDHAIGDLADGIVEKLKPAFAQVNPEHLSVTAVTRELRKVLNEPNLVRVMVQKELRANDVLRAIERDHPMGSLPFSEAEQALYQHALSLLVPSLVDVANQLPSFEVANARQTLTHLVDIAGDTEAILAQVAPIADIAAQVQTLSANQQAKDLEAESVTERFERTYIAALRRQLNGFELMGVADREETDQIELDVAYISLQLAMIGTPAADGTPISFEQFLNQFGSVSTAGLIEGPAGSGKTTLLRWAAINAGQTQLDLTHLAVSAWRREAFRVSESELMDSGTDVNALPREPRDHMFRRSGGRLSAAGFDFQMTVDFAYLGMTYGLYWKNRIPFFISLRDCQQGRLPDIDDYPNISTVSTISPPPDGWVQSVLAEKRGLVIWDGLDEVPPRHRGRLLKAIGGVIASYPGNYFLLSTRPGIRTSQLSEFKLQSAEIHPMALLDVQRFIERWHAAMAEVLKRRGSDRADALPALGETLKRKLSSEPTLFHLVTNPLLCSAICSLHYVDQGYLPDHQARLCEDLCKMLLHDRDLRRGAILEHLPQPYANLSYLEKKQLARHIAREMVQHGRSTISLNEAETLIQLQLPTFSHAQADEAQVIAETLVVRGGLLRARQACRVEFVHNTLKEYLAAESLTSGLTDNLVHQALHSSGQERLTWHNIAVFAAAGPESFANPLIQNLLQAELQGPKDRQRFILALRCMAAAPSLHPDLRSLQHELEAELFPPRNFSEASRLAEMGDHVIRFLRPQPGVKMSAPHLAACVRTLRLIGTEAARHALQEYLHYRQKAVVSELIQAVNPLDIQAVMEEIKNTGTPPDASLHYIQDLELLRSAVELKYLDLGVTQVVDVSPLSGLMNLQYLGLGFTQVVDVSPLSDLMNLQALHINGTQVVDISPLSSLTNLQSLELGRTQVVDISPLSNLTNLQSLSLNGTQVVDISPLSNLENLKTINLFRTPVIDVSPLSNLTNLQYLQLSGTQVIDISPLSNLTNLRSLYLNKTQVVDISPLSNLKNLQSLNLDRTQVIDISPLSNLKI